MEFKFAIMMLVLLLIIGCAEIGKYSYQKSDYDECDFASKGLCEQNNCRWRLTTDAINPDKPIPATCCPTDKIPTLENNDPTDICMILHG